MNEVIVEKVALRNIPISSKKVEPVLELIRGHNLLYALEELKLVNKKAARFIYKLLKSAVANIEHNRRMDPSKMKILRIWVTKGPKLKRYRFAAKGRIRPYQKYRSNIYAEIGYGT